MQLLQLLVLTNVPPTLVPVSAAPLFDDLKKSLRFLSEKYSVTVAVQAEPALVRAEPSLLLSLVYNLADNACKARRGNRDDFRPLGGGRLSDRRRRSWPRHSRGASG